MVTGFSGRARKRRKGESGVAGKRVKLPCHQKGGNVGNFGLWWSEG